MLKRQVEASLLKAAKGYPIVAITGPRQSGKTTLVRSLFSHKPYVSLEDLDIREYAQRDPRAFLAQYSEGAIIDEVQKVPSVFSYLQTLVDSQKRMGAFILTGSQQFDLMAGITQSLAGRVALHELLPFSLSELQDSDKSPETVEKLLFNGLYPPIYDRDLDPTHWYGNYFATYIERDVRQLLKVHDLRAFQIFVKMCAARTGSLLNLSSLANDCGITHNTAKSWLSILEASYIVFLLPPHYQNFNKRLIKSPKLYFCDTGLAAYLLGIGAPGQLTIHPMRGALFETWVLTEAIKQRFNRGLKSNLYFWRDVQGHEVDILIDNAGILTPVEVKSGQTISNDYFEGLKTWRGISKRSSSADSLIYAGERNYMDNGIHVQGWETVRWPIGE